MLHQGYKPLESDCWLATILGPTALHTVLTCACQLKGPTLRLAALQQKGLDDCYWCDKGATKG